MSTRRIGILALLASLAAPFLLVGTFFVPETFKPVVFVSSVLLVLVALVLGIWKFKPSDAAAAATVVVGVELLLVVGALVLIVFTGDWN